MNNRQKGTEGEELALKYLIQKGYEYIDKNWHYSKAAEIDLIMKDKDTLVFVEVKARSNLNFGHPFEAITQTKIKNLHCATHAYLAQTKIKFKNFRIDGIAIIKSPPSIEHLKNIC